MGLHFDDFWGFGPRRTQMFLFSISAPHCDVVNFLPKWYNDTCVNAIGSGLESACGKFIFDNFDALADNRVIQVSAEADFGKPGVPFLKCRGRPERQFQYITDLMVHQAYWAGGSYHVEVQSSRCLASPIVQSADWKHGLFKISQLDQEADVVMAVNNTGWFVTIVSFAYGIVTICMIIYGILAAILRSRRVHYVPVGARFLQEWRICKVLLPFMTVASRAPHGENRLITFKGVAFMASDVWMNHWLYIALSMLDAVTNIRSTYIVFQTGTWMLSNKTNTENFLFTCSALTKITWIICLVHSLLRLGVKLVLNSIRKFKFIRPHVRERLEWYVDATAMLTSYKIYSILLCFVLYVMLKARKTTTLMLRQTPYKRGVYGGDPNIARFWGSEIVCDMVMTVSLVLVSGVALSSLTLCTRYRYITRNGMLRLLQTRYGVVGWDVYVALEALGLDPYNPALVEDGVCTTSCSIGAVLQQLYTSAMSGHVTLAGDHIFMENGFSKEVQKPRYAIKKAIAIGLCDPKHTGFGPSTKYTANHVDSTEHGTRHRENATSAVLPEDQDAVTPGLAMKKSLFDRKLKIVADGYFGKVLLIDEDDPGRVVKSSTTTAMEFEANELLSVLSIMDIKPLLGDEKKLHFA
jgi:hypothetical protein